MFKRLYLNIKNIVITLLMAMFFSCNKSYNEVNKLGLSENEPAGVAENFNLKQTDSGYVKANLVSKEMLDFSNRIFPYREFKKGMTLHLFDKGVLKSTVTSNYAIVYDKTNLVDLQGDVIVTTTDHRELKTEQLYYDQKKEWVFTNQPVTFFLKNDVIKGNGFDSNAKFTNAEVLEVTGIFTVKDE